MFDSSGTPPREVPPSVGGETAPASGAGPRAQLENAPPIPSRSPIAGWALNLLIVVVFAFFAFSVYWLYRESRHRAAAEALAQQRLVDEKAALQGAQGPGDLQAAADTALRFLTARPEFAQEVGELLQPDQPVEYRMQRTDELGHPDDMRFRMTVRGAKAHVWYDTILRLRHGEWQLLSAILTVPDSSKPDGRREVRLLEPAPREPEAP